MKTSLTIVRHAESALNGVMANSPSFFSDPKTRDLFLDTPDHKVPITARGIAQAVETGRGLSKREIKYSVAIHTGYARTKQTLEQIKVFVEVENIEESVDLRERENGYSYVMTKGELSENFPWCEQYWKTFGPVFARPIGGESLLDVRARVKPAIMDILASHKGENILLVTHGRVLSVLRSIFEKWSTDEFESFIKDSGQGPVNCGVTEYSFDDELRPTLVAYNQKYW